MIETPTAVEDAAGGVDFVQEIANDPSIGALAHLISLGTAVGYGFSWARHIVDENLNEEQKQALTEKTKTDYVMIEHNHNNMLVTEYYQKHEDINLLHTEKQKLRPWYKFWK